MQRPGGRGANRRADGRQGVADHRIKGPGRLRGSLDPEQLYPRVLPVVSSIKACEEAGIPHRNIIAVQGPFSEELNRAVIGITGSM